MERKRGFEVVKEEHRQNKHIVDIKGMGKTTIYPDIKLPTRGTRTSAGYDFYLPKDVILLPAQKTLIWTDVKAYMQEDEVLQLHIRSSLGIKQGVILSNITGIIDSDYFENPSNDGNIGISLLNTSGRGVELKAGERVMQGIFMKYLTVDNDVPLNATRTGGVGSSGK